MKVLALAFVLLTPFFGFSQRISTYLTGTAAYYKNAREQPIIAEALTVDAEGNAIIAQRNAIWRVNADKSMQMIAGTGLWGYSGDGGPAREAKLGTITALYFDQRAHQLFIADQSGSRIRRITADGTISTITGQGQRTDDGAPATQTKIVSAGRMGLFVDHNGNLYFTERLNRRVVRKIDTLGIVTTVAGKGTSGFSGDGGPALNAEFKSPSGVYVDSLNNIYITDEGNYRIRKIDANGIINTIAGGGNMGISVDLKPATLAYLYGVQGNVSVDAAGNIYAALGGSDKVVKINTAGYISTYAGNFLPYYLGEGYPAVKNGIAYPSDISITNDGDLFIIGTRRLYRVTKSGLLYTEAGNGFEISSNLMPLEDAQFHPFFYYGGVVNPANELIFSSTAASLSATYYILKYDTTHSLSRASGKYKNPDSSVSTILLTGQVLGMDKKGSIYYSDSNYIKKLNKNGFIELVAGQGVYGETGDGGLAISASIGGVRGFAEDSAGNLYLSSVPYNFTTHRYEGRIRKIDSNGIISRFAGNDTSTSKGDGGLAINAYLEYPTKLSFDKEGNLLLIDVSTIRKITSQGFIYTIAGNGTADITGDSIPATQTGMNPSSIAVNNANEIFIGVSGKILKIDSDGIMSVFAGKGSGYGENVLALNTTLWPSWLGFTREGDLMMGESGNYRIRLIRFPILWTSAINSAWENPGNWNGGKIPTENDDVVIESGTIVVNSNITVRSLKLSPGVNFSVAPGYTVTVKN